MTRKDLVDAIYHNTDTWSCPKDKCNYSSTTKCRKCAEKLLAKYEKRIYNKGYKAWMKARDKE